MKHIVVDLEMNNVSKKSQAHSICTMETIEIGAVMLDDNLQEVSSFRTYVKPEYNDGILPKITKLTGITNAMVENAPKFNEAFKMFTSWCTGTGDDITIYAWSDSDYNQIRKELVLKEYISSEPERAITEIEWNDFQNEFDNHLGFERQISLKLVLDMAGVDFLGREHDALDDARNTAELLQIFKDETLFDKTLRKIKEAMEPTDFGTSLGSLIDLSIFACA